MTIYDLLSFRGPGDSILKDGSIQYYQEIVVVFFSFSIMLLCLYVNQILSFIDSHVSCLLAVYIFFLSHYYDFIIFFAFFTFNALIICLVSIPLNHV